MKLTVFDLYTTDAAFNLAAEEYALDSLPRDRTVFMLWQNRNAVIVGKHQNTLAEIDPDYVRERGIQVVRRLSGGGAVYHDLGNLNYTFITDAGDAGALDFRLFCAPVLRTLASFGVPAELNGRNDMTIGGKKFSGSAQLLRQGRILHHGTILYASDLQVLARALRADESKFQSKASKSVRSRVTNVTEHMPAPVPLETFRQTLLAQVLESGDGTPTSFAEADLAAIRQLRRERYDTWAWNYGASPPCTLRLRRRFEGCGTVEALLCVENGVISSLVFQGDFFSLLPPEELAARFLGRRPEREEYRAVLSEIRAEDYIAGLDGEGLLSLLCGGNGC